MIRGLSLVALVAIALLGAFIAKLPELYPRPVLAAPERQTLSICKSEYALCTAARCVAIPGHSGQVSCTCEVVEGYSAGTTTCRAPKKTPQGMKILSRYYPVNSLAICRNGETWADCLNKPCIVDAKNPAKSNCTCSEVRNQGAYVIVTGKYTKSTCTSGTVISSAALRDELLVTNFLRLNKLLPARPFKVLNP